MVLHQREKRLLNRTLLCCPCHVTTPSQTPSGHALIALRNYTGLPMIRVLCSASSPAYSFPRHRHISYISQVRYDHAQRWRLISKSKHLYSILDLGSKINERTRRPWIYE